MSTCTNSTKPILVSSVPITWQVSKQQPTLQQNDAQEDYPSNKVHQLHCNLEFWTAVQGTEWNAQFYWQTLADISTCDLTGIQDLLMRQHEGGQQPVSKRKLIHVRFTVYLQVGKIGDWLFTTMLTFGKKTST